MVQVRESKFLALFQISDFVEKCATGSRKVGGARASSPDLGTVRLLTVRGLTVN